MSRIRCTKPEFWISEQIISLSPIARLLFIGSWNFCDDNGVHPASYVRLKAEVFPADPFSLDEMKAWVDELIKNGLYLEYTVDGKKYWLVTGWKKHQRIDKPNPRYPLPPNMLNDSISSQRIISNDSSITPRTVINSSPLEGKGKEGKGKEKDTVVSYADAITVSNNLKKRDVPHQEVVELYHSILPMCRPVRTWNKKRRNLLLQRWRENPKHQNLEFWKKYFEYAERSPFLTGKVPGREGHPPFSADLEWLIEPDNFAKVIEGKYHGGHLE